MVFVFVFEFVFVYAFVHASLFVFVTRPSTHDSPRPESPTSALLHLLDHDVISHLCRVTCGFCRAPPTHIKHATYIVPYKGKQPGHGHPSTRAGGRVDHGTTRGLARYKVCHTVGFLVVPYSASVFSYTVSIRPCIVGYLNVGTTNYQLRHDFGATNFVLEL